MKLTGDFAWDMEKYVHQAPLKWFVRSVQVDFEVDKDVELIVKFTWPRPLHYLFGVPRKILTLDPGWKWCKTCRRWTRMYYDSGEWWC